MLLGSPASAGGAMLSPKSSPQKAYESPYNSPTFNLDMSIKVDAPVGAMSISPSSRDVVLASRQGLHIIDLDNPYDPPRFLQHLTAWSVADVQWSPHASQPNWVVSTSNQNAIVWNLAMPSSKSIEFVLKSHTRAITDINFSAHDPNTLATCSIDSFVHVWDLRAYERPVMSFCDWFAGATQVKFNRRDEYILASAHDKHVYVWDRRMGAKELRKITAHNTKIYGLDWNRTRKTGFITCALDKTVRFWDYENTPPSDTPEQVIHTSFPVWRARHTPFGWGVMTMPQRGDTSLYLWDRRPSRAVKDEPVQKFDGHTEYPKEFVWRWRGGQQDDNDDREFQLISWGLDRELRLWDVDKSVLAKVGHDPSKKLRFRITRKGAKYITYRDEEAVKKQLALETKEMSKIPKLSLSMDGKITPRGAGESGLSLLSSTSLHYKLALTQATSNSGISSKDRRFEKSLDITREGGFMRARRRTRIDTNPIAWMRGVKIGRKSSDQAQAGQDGRRASSDFPLSWDIPENLGDEISYVGNKFRGVKFEKVNIAQRICVISLSGPWGLDGKWIFIRVQVTFPEEYPSDRASIPEFQIEETNVIGRDKIDLIIGNLCRIATAHVIKKKVCLEACLSYLLGERSMDAPMLDSDDEDESSTDDEEIVNIGAHGDDEEGIASPTTRSDQASVPLPKQCGATWSRDGRLICFFPPKEERPKMSLFSTLSMGDSVRGPNGNRIFEGFGRLFLGVEPPGTDNGDVSDSSFSTDSSDGDTAIHGHHLAWHLRGASTGIVRGLNRRTRSADRSTQRSTGTGIKTITADSSRGKTVVSIRDMSHMLPSKKDLAMEYEIGEGPDVCRHNSEVAERHGFVELADVWRLCSMILSNSVPLHAVQNPKDKYGNWGEKIMVVAKRASLAAMANSFGERKDSKDSGVELDFDEVSSGEGSDTDIEGMSDAGFWGKVKWGDHPLGAKWLVPEIFKHYEIVGDVQMLAMLSCAMAESEKAPGKDGTSIMETMAIDIPLGPGSRRQSLTTDYYADYSSFLQANSSGGANFSISPAHPSALTPLHVLAISSPGSYSSSPHFGSDPTHMLGSFTDATPPIGHGPLYDYGLHSLSSSPEIFHHRSNSGRTGSGLSSQFQGSRSFNPTNASPSNAAMNRRHGNSPVLQTLSNVTWGAVTTFGSGSRNRAESTISDSDSDTTYEDDIDQVQITLLNQSQFDTEANIGTSLLDPEKSDLYRAWRESYANLLYDWGLPLKRLEVLKFNASCYLDRPNGRLTGSSSDNDRPGSGGLSSPDLSDFSQHGRLRSRQPNTRGLNKPIATAPQKWDGLEMAGCCNRCGAVLDVTSGAKGECKACKRRQVTMVCVICNTTIKGLFAPCLRCGHVCHADCHRGWFGVGEKKENEMEIEDEEQKEDEESGDEEVCPSGCGCNCVWGNEEEVETVGAGLEGRGIGVAVREAPGVAGRAALRVGRYDGGVMDPWGDYLW